MMRERGYWNSTPWVSAWKTSLVPTQRFVLGLRQSRTQAEILTTWQHGIQSRHWIHFCHFGSIVRFALVLSGSLGGILFWAGFGKKNRCTWSEFVKWLSVKLSWTKIKVIFWATFLRLIRDGPWCSGSCGISRHWRKRRPQFHERLRWRPSPFAGVAIQQFLEIPMPSNHPPSYLQRNTNGKPQFFHQDVFKICFADCIYIYIYIQFSKRNGCVCVCGTICRKTDRWRNGTFASDILRCHLGCIHPPFTCYCSGEKALCRSGF